MSQKEVSRLECLEKLANKRLSQIEAATLLGVSTRQVRRLQRAYEAAGAQGLISRHRGKRGNNKLANQTKEKAIKLIQAHYPDFGANTRP